MHRELKKRLTYSNPHKKRELLVVLSKRCRRGAGSKVVGPATVSASASGQASFVGPGVEETASSLRSADWDDFFRCAG